MWALSRCRATSGAATGEQVGSADQRGTVFYPNSTPAEFVGPKLGL